MYVESKGRKTQMWVVKMPRYLSEILETLPSGSELGYLDTSKEEVEWMADAEGRVTLGAALSIPGLPKKYTLVPLAARDDLLCFSERRGAVAIEGTVRKEGYVQPEISKEYLQFKKARERLMRKPQRTVKVVDSLSEGRRIERQGGASEYDLLARKRKKLQQERKRERLGKTEVMEILFRAFDEHPYWTLKDLADRSGQPQAYIQEILGEIATVNKRSHKAMYELRPEYKN